MGSSFIAKIAILAITLLCSLSTAAPYSKFSNDGIVSGDTADQNWGGINMRPLPGTASFTVVSANFIIPVARLPRSSASLPSAKYDGSIWVGISSESTQAIFQSGIYLEVTKNVNGSVATRYVAWYEWWPANVVDIWDFVVRPGDELYIVLSLTNSISGTLYMKNLSTGQVHQQVVNAPEPVANNGVGARVQWIAETYLGLDPLEDFDTVQFTDCRVSTSDSVIPNWGDSDVKVMMRDGITLSSTAVFPGNSTVQVSYVGP